MSKLPVDLPGFNVKKMAFQILKKQGGDEILKHQAEMESESLGVANEILSKADMDEIYNHLTVEDRAEQLTDGVIALVSDEFHKYYVEQFTYHVLDCEIDYVLPFSQMSSDEFEEVKEGWYNSYLENGVIDEDETIDEVSNKHTQSVCGCSLSIFENEIVNWDKEKHVEVLERMFSGDDYNKDNRVFIGHKTAHQAMKKALENI